MTERELLSAYGMDPDDLTRPMAGSHRTIERRPEMSRGALCAIPMRRHRDVSGCTAPGELDPPGHHRAGRR